MRTARRVHSLCTAIRDSARALVQRQPPGPSSMVRVACLTCGPVMIDVLEARVTSTPSGFSCEGVCPQCRADLLIDLSTETCLMLLAGGVRPPGIPNHWPGLDLGADRLGELMQGEREDRST